MSKVSKRTIEKLAVGAILTALVVVLQLLGSFIRFGPFSISLVLIPIVIGAAITDWKIGGWLGFVFGDAAAFMTIDVAGTIATVLLKGTLCGIGAGLAFKMLSKANNYLAVVVSAIVCPAINTGIFLLGCRLFFMEEIISWGAAEGFTNAVQYMFLGLAGGNFLFELGVNIVLAPVIYRIIKAIRKI